MSIEVLEPDLEEQLVARLREWFQRSAPKTKAFAVPEITFRIGEAGADEDGTLCLRAHTEEKTYLDDIDGRVPGKRYDEI